MIPGRFRFNGSVHYYRSKTDSSVRTICGAIESLISEVEEALASDITCNLCKAYSVLGENVDELRKNVFIDAGMIISEYARVYASEHQEQTDEEKREALYLYIQSKLDECRRHVELTRMKEQAFFYHGQETFLALSAERRENLRKLDTKYRPDTTLIPKTAKPTLSKEDKAVNAIMKLMNLDEPTAREYVRTGVLPEKKD